MIKKTSKNGNHNETDKYLNNSSCDDTPQQKSKRVKTSKRVKKKIINHLNLNVKFVNFTPIIVRIIKDIWTQRSI